MVKLEQQRAEAERLRVEGEKRKQKEKAQRIARMLESAFDGDMVEIQTVLEEVRIYPLESHTTVGLVP